jgi:hypothetical protein
MALDRGLARPPAAAQIRSAASSHRVQAFLAGRHEPTQKAIVVGSQRWDPLNRKRAIVT